MNSVKLATSGLNYSNSSSLSSSKYSYIDLSIVGSSINPLEFSNKLSTENSFNKLVNNCIVGLLAILRLS